MPKYHVDQVHGTVETCRATKHCIVGLPIEDHKRDPEEAVAAHEVLLTEFVANAEKTDPAYTTVIPELTLSRNDAGVLRCTNYKSYLRSLEELNLEKHVTKTIPKTKVHFGSSEECAQNALALEFWDRVARNQAAKANYPFLTARAEMQVQTKPPAQENVRSEWDQLFMLFMNPIFFIGSGNKRSKKEAAQVAANSWFRKATLSPSY